MRGNHLPTRTGSVYSQNYQEQKSHTNISLMQNVHVASRPELNVLSNGALVLAVSLIVSTVKWIRLLTEAVLAILLHFQRI